MAEQAAARQRLYTSLAADLPSDLGPGIRAALSREERAQLQQAVPSGPGPLRIGAVKKLAPAVQVSGLEQARVSKRGTSVASGTLQATDDGGFVWATTVASPGAARLRVQLIGVDLPPGAALYFVGADGEAYGPYDGRGPNGDGEFWTDSVSGSEGVVLVRHIGPASAAERRQTAFSIAAVGHVAPELLVPEEQVGEPFCGNPSCVIDVSCLTDPAVADVTSAVAQLEWIAGAYIYTCTGGLLADTDASTQIPYLLTANHCISRAKDARNLEAFFFYRTSACGQSCPSNAGFPKTLGATIKATNGTGDFTLLTLNQMPPSGTVMLGWNALRWPSPRGVDLYRISHPNFGAAGVLASSRRHRRRNLWRLAARRAHLQSGHRGCHRRRQQRVAGGERRRPGGRPALRQLRNQRRRSVRRGRRTRPSTAPWHPTSPRSRRSSTRRPPRALRPAPPCGASANCCSNNCKGPSGRKTCK